MRVAWTASPWHRNSFSTNDCRPSTNHRLKLRDNTKRLTVRRSHQSTSVWAYFSRNRHRNRFRRRHSCKTRLSRSTSHRWKWSKYTSCHKRMLTNSYSTSTTNRHYSCSRRNSFNPSWKSRVIRLIRGEKLWRIFSMASSKVRRMSKKKTLSLQSSQRPDLASKFWKDAKTNRNSRKCWISLQIAPRHKKCGKKSRILNQSAIAGKPTKSQETSSANHAWNGTALKAVWTNTSSWSIPRMQPVSSYQKRAPTASSSTKWSETWSKSERNLLLKRNYFHSVRPKGALK